jgi:hypothetical protein
MTEEDYEQLLERVKELRMLLLFEEPCPLYEEIEDGME